jgi:ABC-type nitrate/sulfonate/bicarbonate transport system substrate-binding protein
MDAGLLMVMQIPRQGSEMRLLIKSWVARALLSISLVAATVGTSYGEDKVVHIDAVAEQLSPSIGLPATVVAVSPKRVSYGILPINNEVIASQQRIADTFVALGLAPKHLNVSDLQRKPGS